MAGPAAPLALLLSHSVQPASGSVTVHCRVQNRTLEEVRGVEVSRIFRPSFSFGTKLRFACALSCSQARLYPRPIAGVQKKPPHDLPSLCHPTFLSTQVVFVPCGPLAPESRRPIRFAYPIPDKQASHPPLRTGRLRAWGAPCPRVPPPHELQAGAPAPGRVHRLGCEAGHRRVWWPGAAAHHHPPCTGECVVILCLYGMVWYSRWAGYCRPWRAGAAAPSASLCEVGSRGALQSISEQYRAGLSPHASTLAASQDGKRELPCTPTSNQARPKPVTFLLPACCSCRMVSPSSAASPTPSPR